MGSQIVGMVPIVAGPCVAYVLRGKGALIAIGAGILAAWLLPIVLSSTVGAVSSAQTTA